MCLLDKYVFKVRCFVLTAWSSHSPRDQDDSMSFWMAAVYLQKREAVQGL